MQNLFSNPIPPAVLAQVLALLQQIANLLAPYLRPLSPEERQQLPKMADKTVAFVQKALDYATTTPAFKPQFVDLAEFQQDTAALQAMTPVGQLADSLALDLDSTMMLAGSDAYTAALAVYQYVKYLAANNHPGAQAAYDDMAKRFPGKSGGNGRPPKPLQGGQ